MLAATDLFEDARPLNLPTETAEGSLKRLTFTDADTGHALHHLSRAGSAKARKIREPLGRVKSFGSGGAERQIDLDARLQRVAHVGLLGHAHDPRSQAGELGLDLLVAAVQVVDPAHLRDARGG